MPAFPLFVTLEHRRCLVCGGGKVALRKINTLLKFGADIRVLSEEVCDPIRSLLENSEAAVRAAMGTLEDELSAAFLVVCATDDEFFNHQTARMCREWGVWVNSATSAGDSSFIFPAVVVREDICVGISTGGEAPSLSKHMRVQAEAHIPVWYGRLGKRLETIRGMLKSRINSPAQRSRLMGIFTEYGLSHEGEIPDAWIGQILAEWKETSERYAIMSGQDDREEMNL